MRSLEPMAKSSNYPLKKERKRIQETKKLEDEDFDLYLQKKRRIQEDMQKVSQKDTSSSPTKRNTMTKGQRSIDDLLLWKEAKDRKFIAMQIDKMNETYTFRPQINKSDLISRASNYSNIKVTSFKRLYEDAFKREVIRHNLQAEQVSQMFHPRLNKIRDRASSKKQTKITTIDSSLLNNDSVTKQEGRHLYLPAKGRDVADHEHSSSKKENKQKQKPKLKVRAQRSTKVQNTKRRVPGAHAPWVPPKQKNSLKPQKLIPS